MQVFIHIGYPKTGSSAIQSHIFTNQRWFENHGFYIPRAGYASGLGHCFLLTGANPLQSIDSKNPTSDPPGQLSMLSSELDVCSEKGFEKALISWEGLALLDDLAISNIYQALKMHQVTLLAYVRDPIDLYQSSILQEVESLWHFGEDIIRQDHDIRERKLLTFDFVSTLENWRSCFNGDLAIRVKVFDKTRLIDGNVVLDFLDWLGLTLDENFSLQTKLVNHSLDTKAATLLLIAKAAGLHHGGLINLSRALSELTGKQINKSRSFLSPEGRAILKSYFQKPNALLAQKYPPENSAGDASLFAETKAAVGVENSSEEQEYLRQLYLELKTPKLETWEGGPLASRNLGILTRAPSRGWTLPQIPGVWAVGSLSTLAFLLPELHPNEGPRGIRLSILGTYASGYTNTVLTVNGSSEKLDLSSTELDIDMSEEVRSMGVQLTLEHSLNDSLAEEVEQTKNPPAFRLELLAYSFIWD